ncbi:MAG: diguanylate cyclase [Betaproteobacteria bacterium]
MNDALRIARPAWVPAGILAAAALLVWVGRPLPPTLAGLATAGPYAVLAAASFLSWWFNRGRAFVLAMSLIGAFGAWQALPTPAVYVALALFVPLNALLAMLRPELGARYGMALKWLALLLLEAIVLWGLTRAAVPDAAFDSFLLRSPPTPLAARVVFAAAFAAAVWRAWPDFTPTQAGNAGALAAYLVATEWARHPGAYSLFMTAAGLMILVAVLHESHRLAFRDQLTGLPARRALEERLRTLGGDYTIAMVDVDHFKQFNDRHGHDVGDQVLRLVAGRLAEVGGGGTAYRYGGEEFSVIFPGLRAKRAQPVLEALREVIESYRMAMRGEDRPKKADEGAKRRGRKPEPAEEALSVTVSIGLASPNRRRTSPQLVLQAADEALYAAKQAGRNRVVAAK